MKPQSKSSTHNLQGLPELPAFLITTTHKSATFVACRGIRSLPSVSRRRLIDGLCSNLSVLCVSAEASISSARVAGTELLESEGNAPEQEALADVHRSALTAYVFLLHWLTLQLEKVRCLLSEMPSISGAKVFVSDLAR